MIEMFKAEILTPKIIKTLNLNVFIAIKRYREIGIVANYCKTNHVECAIIIFKISEKN